MPMDGQPLLVLLTLAFARPGTAVAISATAVLHHSSSFRFNGHLGTHAHLVASAKTVRTTTCMSLSKEKVIEQPPHVMFICKANSCRSQMAHGFMEQFAAGKVVTQSSGCIAASVLNVNAAEVMNEIGIDLSGYESNGLDEFDPEAAPYAAVVCLCGCKELVPKEWQRAGSGRFFDWDVDDPPEMDPGDLSVYRRVRDEIQERVATLYEAITSTAV